jgi:hypothetical protein
MREPFIDDVGTRVRATTKDRRSSNATRVFVTRARQGALVLWLNALFVLSLVALVTAGPAPVALHVAARRLIRGEAGVTRAYIGALGRHYLFGWRWLLMNGAVAYVLLASALAYPRMWPGVAGSSMAGVSVGALVLWCLLQLFVLSVALEQERSRLRTALGNSLVIWLRRPGPSSLLALGVLFAVSALLTVPVLLAVVLPAGIACATTQQTAVAVRELASRPGELDATD